VSPLRENGATSLAADTPNVEAVSPREEAHGGLRVVYHNTRNAIVIMPSKNKTKQMRRRWKRQLKEGVRNIKHNHEWVATPASLPHLVFALVSEYPTAVVTPNPPGHLKDSLCTVAFRRTRSIMTVTCGMSWKQITRAVEKKRDFVPGPRCCGICCEERSGPASNVSCNRCANSFCGECYIGLFRTGRGIIRCPFCRDEFGFLMSPQDVERGVRMIRSKLIGR
jgi:hypothetical protein